MDRVRLLRHARIHATLCAGLSLLALTHPAYGGQDKSSAAQTEALNAVAMSMYFSSSTYISLPTVDTMDRVKSRCWSLTWREQVHMLIPAPICAGVFGITRITEG